MSDWVQELNERSKDDRAIIVGSEVRALCAEVARLTLALEEARAEVERLTRAINLFTENTDNAAGKANALAFALLKRAEAAESEVSRLRGEREDLGVACATIQCATHQGRDDFGCSTCRGLRVVHMVRSGRAWSLEHEIRQLQRESKAIGAFIDAAISDRDHYEAAAAAAESEVSRLRGQVEGAQAEVKRVRDLIDRDRTGLAEALEKVGKEISGRWWMRPFIDGGNWASYSYEEQRETTLRKEIGWAFDAIAKLAAEGLRESGRRADAAFRPPALPPPSAPADDSK